MKRTVVWLDGRIIFMSDARIHEWKQAFQVDITERLNPGRHEIRIAVMNQDGHPALIAYCKALGIATSERWEATIDGKTWLPYPFVPGRTPSSAIGSSISILPWRMRRSLCL